VEDVRLVVSHISGFLMEAGMSILQLAVECGAVIPKIVTEYFYRGAFTHGATFPTAFMRIPASSQASMIRLIAALILRREWGMCFSTT
jgi:hypothetical protein